ncbi:MAG: OmpA family protein [Polyangiaceae bacterium]|nr:OmpA family protein [Polyangiaceae bacterium]
MTKNQGYLRGVLATFALISAAGSGACVAATAPQQLVNARASYASAAAGPAARLTPSELVDAKRALDAAERSFEKYGNTGETLDAAYIAQRRAEIAAARGGIAAAEAEQERGTTKLASVREGRLDAVRTALRASQGQVASSDLALAATGAELRATDRALVAEKKGRAEADLRAKDALNKLALAASLAVKEEPRGTVITLPGNVLFATGKHELLPGAMSKLDAVAVALKSQPDVSILVEGHTDSQGTPADNLALSQRRGESVRAYLASKAVPKEQLSSVGIGESRPLGDNATIDGRGQNRRVEIIVTPREKR